MPFLTSARRALSAFTLLLATARSQTCYFPDGQTVSSDTPCGGSNGTASACCPADSFCLDNGLCYGEGLVSRSSCTDATWGSPACAGYCTTESANGFVGITPCSSNGETNTFVCGLNTTDCQSDSNTFDMIGGSGLQLRASQVATILQSVLATSPSATAGAQVTVTATATADLTGYHSSADMAALGCGVGIPLFIALCAALYFLHRERRKYRKPKLMYKLPDDCKDEFSFRPPPIPSAHISTYPPSSVSDAMSIAASRRASFKTVGVHKPGHLQNFIERYETMKAKQGVREIQRHELDTGFAKELPRHELPEGRTSR